MSLELRKQLKEVILAAKFSHFNAVFVSCCSKCKDRCYFLTVVDTSLKKCPASEKIPKAVLVFVIGCSI